MSQPEVREVKVNVHPEAHLGIATITAARKATQMSAVNFTAKTFAQGARVAIDEIPDADIIRAWHCEFTGDFQRADQKTRIDDLGAHIGSFKVGEIDLEGFPALTDAATSVLTNPNVSGLYIPCEETYAYAILKGKLNDREIRMKPKERWYRSSAVTGDEEYTVHPADVSESVNGMLVMTQMMTITSFMTKPLYFGLSNSVLHMMRLRN